MVSEWQHFMHVTFLWSWTISITKKTHHIKIWYLALCLQPPAKTDTWSELSCLQGGATGASLRGRSQNMVWGEITDTGGCNAPHCDIRKGWYGCFGKHFLKVQWAWGQRFFSLSGLLMETCTGVKVWSFQSVVIHLFLFRILHLHAF